MKINSTTRETGSHETPNKENREKQAHEVEGQLSLVIVDNTFVLQQLGR